MSLSTSIGVRKALRKGTKVEKNMTMRKIRASALLDLKLIKRR
jgi:hypothetical protein